MLEVDWFEALLEWASLLHTKELQYVAISGDDLVFLRGIPKVLTIAREGEVLLWEGFVEWLTK